MAKPSIHDVLHNFVINEPYSVTEIEFVIPKTSQMKGFLVTKSPSVIILLYDPGDVVLLCILGQE